MTADLTGLEPMIRLTAGDHTPWRRLTHFKPPARILYADDDASTRRLGEQVLAQSGYRVDVAADGAEAWDALRAGNYDLLITDHQMPHLTGLELATKARHAGMRLPIVLTSGSVDALRNPASAWLALAARLPKPFGTEALLETVGQTLHAAGHSLLHDASRVSVLARSSTIQPYPHCGINE